MGDHYCCSVCHQRYDCCVCAEDMKVDKTKIVEVSIPKRGYARTISLEKSETNSSYSSCAFCGKDPCECTKAGWPGSLTLKPAMLSQKQLDAIITTFSDKKEMKTEAVKADSGKMDWSLLPIESVEEIIKVLEFGATKYDDWNWATGEGFKYTRVFNATMRHLWAWFKGEDNDPETGLSHWAHAGCNVLFMLHFIKNKHRYNQDDRKFFRAK